MKKISLLVIAIVSIFTSCTTDEIETFDQNNYLSFKSSAISYSFVFEDETTKSVIFDIPVVYAGRYRDFDAKFSILPITEGSTAIEGKQYELLNPEEQVITSGTNSGSAKIKLIRTNEMKDENITLKLAITENDFFKPGITDSITISITDRVIKPDWWSSNYTYSRYLGNYSKTKLLLWLEFMGIKDGSDPFDQDEYIQWLDYGTGNFIYKNYRDSMVKPKVMEFRDWLIKQKDNPFDPDTNTYVAESLGSF